MDFKRIVPTLLLSGKRLVKGTSFNTFVDVGDPVSQSMIFDAQGADEIYLVDISASIDQRTIPSELIRQINKKCRLPIAAGGGIKNVSDALSLFEAGADKVVVNTNFFSNPKMIKGIADTVGSQAVNISIDVKKDTKGYQIYTHSGANLTGMSLKEAIDCAQFYGAGEITLTSIDREGSLRGFDIELYQTVEDSIRLPLIASGGCGRYKDIVDLFENTKVDACGIGKMLSLRDYDVVRIKSYIKGKHVVTRDA